MGTRGRFTYQESFQMGRREGALLLTVGLQEDKQAWKCMLSKAKQFSCCANSLTLFHPATCPQLTSSSWPIALFFCLEKHTHLQILKQTDNVTLFCKV